MLDDNNPFERQQGIEAGLAICRGALQTVVYLDLGISKGMTYGIEAAKDAGRLVLKRSLFPGVNQEEVDELIFEEYKKHELPSPEDIRDIYGRILQ